MSTTLNGMFSKPKPHRIDFIKENKRRLKEISTMVNQNQSKSRFNSANSKGSQTEITNSRSSSTVLKENRNRSSSSKLSSKGSMVVFVQERKDKRSISNVQLSAKQRSSSRVGILKNQSCQTIDPRRCDQLYHEGVIKYPSNKVMQQIAEAEKQKANRLDAHVKKEYYKRNKIKQKSPDGFIIHPVNSKLSGVGDEGSEAQINSEEEEVDENVEEGVKGISEEEEKAKPTQPLKAAEIIKKTTEEHLSVRSGHVNSKGDIKHNKKTTKKTKEAENLKFDPQCPPGHIPLPDNERKKTLHMLRVSHAELVKEMNLLPVRTDTLRVRQKKIQLENQLNKIEEGIKVFNKSKVYVKIEE